MSQKKSANVETYQEIKILDSFLWFVENCLPQKKKRSSHKKFRLDNFESNTINKIKKLASARSKSLKGDFYNTKVTFTVGNWALPYLNFLKTIKLLKQKFFKNIDYKLFLILNLLNFTKYIFRGLKFVID